jgi:hypothetical protein
MPSANVENLVNIATDLVKKRLALRESAPTLFEALANIDDQLRSATNAVFASGEQNELTTEQKFLINNSVNSSRSALTNLERDYTPDKEDIVGELQDIQKVDFRALDKLQGSDPELYSRLVKGGIVIDTGKG